MKRIQALEQHDRPREKLFAKGASALSDEELLAILLGSGSREHCVRVLAQKTLAVLDNKNGNLQVSDLCALKGIGAAKGSVIAAALEFSRRRIRPEGIAIRQPGDILPLIQHLSDRKQEHFICVSLNGAHEVIATRVLTVGLLNSSQIHPREVFCDPIVDRACSIVCAHNHPSGNVKPSPEDRRVTEILQDAGKLLGINFLDHIIFSRRAYYSFKEDCEYAISRTT